MYIFQLLSNVAAVEISVKDGLGFRGSSYLELSRSLLPHNATDAAAETILIMFSTERPDGLLLYQGQEETAGNGGDFLALGVAAGRLQLQYELGGGPANITLADRRVDDGNLQKVEVRRTGRTATITLQDKYTVTGSSPGVLQVNWQTNKCVQKHNKIVSGVIEVNKK
jgi:hypothetical protein